MKINWDSKLLVSASVLVCSSICLSLAVLSHLFSAYQFAATKDISENWFPSVEAIGDIRVAMYQVRRAEMQIALSKKECRADGCAPVLAAARRALTNSESRYAPLVTRGEENRMFLGYKAQRQDYLNTQDAVIDPSASKDAAVARFLSESQQLFDGSIEALNKLTDFNSKEGLKAHATAILQHDRALLCIDILNIMLLIMAGGMIAALYRYATHPRHHSY